MENILLNGSPYEMGEKLGEIFKENKKAFLEKGKKLPPQHKEGREYLIYKYFGNKPQTVITEPEYIYVPVKLNKFQYQHGTESTKLLEKYYPEASTEIKGITDTLGYNYELFAAWMMCMGCCYTLHKNNIVEVRGCTAFSFTCNNKVYYGRDNDLPPSLEKVSQSFRYEPASSYRFVLNTSSFINGEEGMNEYGLVAAMTFVVPNPSQIRPGINSLFLVRYILENCKTVEEGITALQRLPIASSCNILITDKYCNMIVAECSPMRINLRKPEVNKKNENFIVTVNHFSTKTMQKFDKSNQNVYSSEARYQTAHNALTNYEGTDEISFMKDVLRGKLGFMCQYKNINFKTIWSTIFDITENKMFLAQGNPEEAEYDEEKIFL